MDKEPWEDPNHPYYGPLRRMWLVLSWLGLEDSTIEGDSWQDCFLSMYSIYGERESARTVLASILDEV